MVVFFRRRWKTETEAVGKADVIRWLHDLDWPSPKGLKRPFVLKPNCFCGIRTQPQFQIFV